MKGQVLSYLYPAYDYSASGVLAFAIKEYVCLKDLLQEAENWSKSKLICEYTRAVREEAIKQHGEIELDSELALWIE